MALTMSQLRYRLEATDQAFRQTMQNATSRLSQLQETVNRGAAAWRNWSLAAAAAGTAVALALRKVTSETAKTAAEIDKFSKQTGIATSTLQALGYAAEQEHASLETLGQGLVRLTRRTAEAAAGNQAYLASYRRMGIEIRNADGSMRGTEELLLDIAEAFEGISDEGERARIAFNLLGDSGYALLPFLSMGRQEIERLMQEARDLGIIISRENIDRFVQYDAVLGRWRATMRGLRNEVAIAVLPILSLVAQRGAEGVQAFGQWVRENRALVAQGTIVTGALLAFALGLKVVSTGVLVATRGIGLLVSLIGFLTSPIGLVITAVTALYIAWSQNWLGIQDAVTGAWDVISPILDSIREWEKRVIETTWRWIINGLNWMSEVFIPWFQSLPERITQTWAWTVERLDELREAAALVVDKAVTWIVNLVRGMWEVATEWADRVITWTVNLVRGAWEVVAEWIDAVVTWTVNLARGAADAVAEWVGRAVTWVVNLARGAADAVADWVDGAVTWVVNLARGAADAVADWMVRAVTWVVDLTRGAADAVSDWVDRAVTWVVNLVRGTSEQMRDWVDRVVEWTVNLARGSYEAVTDWLSGSVTWVVDLARGTSERVREWIDRVVEWTVNIVRVTADTASRAAQWVLGLLEGRAEARTLTADVDLELQEAEPGWGDRLEAWLRRQLHGLEWQEITEEEFLRLQEELGEQASQLLKIEDDRFFRRTPERLELAADFVLNLGNSVAAFIAGRASYDALTAALRALLTGIGWTWGRLATGASGWLLPALGWTAAIMLALWAGFELLPEETQQSINKFFDDFFNTDLESYVKAALGAGAAALLGIAVGASAVAITIAGALAFAIGLIDWDFIAAKIEPLWQKLQEWYRGKEEQFGWEPGEHGVIRFGVQLLLDVLGIKWGRGQGAQVPQDDFEVRRLLSERDLIERELAGEFGYKLSEQTHQERLRRIREIDEELARLLGGTAAAIPFAATVTQEVQTAASVEALIDAIIKGNPHLEKHRNILTDMAQRLADIAEAKGAPISMQELAEVMALLLSESSTVLGNMEAMENPLRVTSAGFEELNRNGINLINTTEGLNRNLEAGLELFRMYKREFGDPALAAGAYLFPSFARRGEWERVFQRAGTDVVGMSAGEKARRYSAILGSFLTAIPGLQEGAIIPKGPSGDWFPALLASDEAVIPADVWRRGLLAIARWFRRMGVPGYQTGRAPDAGFSVDVFRQEEQRLAEIGVTVETQGRTLLSVFRNLFTALFQTIKRVIQERYPELAEWIEQLEADIEAALTSVDEQFQQTFEAITSGFRSVDTVAQQWTDNLVRGLSDAIAYGRSLTDVFDNFLRMLASRFIETRILGPLFNTFMPGVLGGLPVFHAGGLVLGGAGALVMHNGGIVPGLRSDERLIIAQTGERVLSRTQNAAFEQMLRDGGRGDEPQEVTVNLLVNAVDAASFVTLAQRHPEAITTVVLHDILRNGDVRQAIRNVSRGG